jgi:lipoate---protein ligase
MRGVSDLCYGEKKVAGSSLRVARGKVLFQVAVLVDPDLGLIERYLPMPSREPAYRAGRNHRDFLTTMRTQGFTGAVEEVVAALEARLGEAMAPGVPGLGRWSGKGD